MLVHGIKYGGCEFDKCDHGPACLFTDVEELEKENERLREENKRLKLINRGIVF